MSLCSCWVRDACMVEIFAFRQLHVCTGVRLRAVDISAMGAGRRTWSLRRSPQGLQQACALTEAQRRYMVDGRGRPPAITPEKVRGEAQVGRSIVLVLLHGPLDCRPRAHQSSAISHASLCVETERELRSNRYGIRLSGGGVSQHWV